MAADDRSTDRRALQLLELLAAHGDLLEELAAAGQDLAQFPSGRVGQRRRCRAHHLAIARDQPGIDPVGLSLQAMPRAKSRTRFGLTIAAGTPCATRP